ncbi:MAG: flagellin [Thermoleophilia bacterium]|nr:flagellin [Thermoleophilia bacterium]
MGLQINSNVAAFNTHRILASNSTKLSKSLEKLSSGMRINRASDDAAGLAISEKMRAQISGIEQATRNAQDGISFADTAEGALGEINSMLGRVRDLAVQYQNGTNDVAARQAISAEAQALGTEINRVISSTNFNGVNLLNNATATTLQVGPNATDTTTVSAVNAATTMTTLNINTLFPAAGTAGTANIASIDTAITSITGFRGTFGATSNRLEHTINSLGIAQENMMAAESRIRDVDVAQEMTNLSKLQILQESGIAMLAQANVQHSNLLKLLQ